MSWFCTTNICLNVATVSTRLLRGNHGWRLTACKHVVLVTRCFWGNLAVTWSRRKRVKFWTFCNFQMGFPKRFGSRLCQNQVKVVWIQIFKARASRNSGSNFLGRARSVSTFSCDPLASAAIWRWHEVGKIGGGKFGLFVIFRLDFPKGLGWGLYKTKLKQWFVETAVLLCN